MKTSFNTWLAELAAAGLGGSALTEADIPPATRGQAWSMTVILAGNWTGGTMAGTVSASPDAASPLATMTASAASYDAQTGYTSWTLSLAAGVFSSTAPDSDGDGVEYLPFTLRFTPSGGATKTIVGGAFTIIGKA